MKSGVTDADEIQMMFHGTKNANSYTVLGSKNGIDLHFTLDYCAHGVGNYFAF